jgi:hypothetical protein
MLNHTLLVEAATYKSYGYVAATGSGEELYSLSPTRRVRSRMWRSDIERRSKRAPNDALPRPFAVCSRGAITAVAKLAVAGAITCVPSPAKGR